jgi:vacuolar-type H+-ATPase subunit E/Vma4
MEQEERLNRIGKEKLLEEIEKNAREEAASVIEQAENTARQKVEAAKGKAGRIEREARERAEAKAEQIINHTEQSIDIRRKRVRLQRNEEIIERVFQLVRQQIGKRAGSKEYVNVLEEWAVEAVLGVDTEGVIISVSAEEKNYVTDDFLARVGKRVRGISGKKVNISVSRENENDYGVVARSEDGRLEYRNQVAMRLHRNRTYYRKLIYRRLGIEGTE